MSGKQGAFQTTAPYQFKEKEMNIFGHDFNVMSAVDLAQLAGKFLGRSEPRPAASGEKREEPLKQQVASILPTRDDEAILIAIDAALANMPGGVEHLANVQQVREILEPHQRDDWRKNIGSIKMTERFEAVIASETITKNRGEQDQADPASHQRRRGGRDQERVERKFERRPIDYEWTDLDPRVRHLILISRIVTAPQGSVTKAKEYLLSAGFIKKQSATQQTAAAAEKTSKEIAATLYRSVAGNRIKPTLDAFDRDIENALTDAERDVLTKRRERYIIEQARVTHAENAQRDWVGKWIFRIFLIIVVGGAFIALTLTRN